MKQPQNIRIEKKNQCFDGRFIKSFFVWTQLQEYLLHGNSDLNIERRVAIWPFLIQFSRNKMIWPFGLFFNLEENSVFLGLFWLNFNKTSNIFWFFKIYLIYFGKFSLKIWPFIPFENLAFFKLLMAKFGLFYFWDLTTLIERTKLD